MSFDLLRPSVSSHAGRRSTTASRSHTFIKHERFGGHSFEPVPEELPPVYVKRGDHADVSRQPSFRKFKIPYRIICSNRYRDSRKLYEEQVLREIEMNLDFMPTAADACYYMRCMAISTFWPPLHNREELKHTSRYFYRLSAKQQSRFNYIMTTDII